MKSDTYRPNHDAGQEVPFEHEPCTYLDDFLGISRVAIVIGIGTRNATLENSGPILYILPSDRLIPLPFVTLRT